MNLSPVIIAIPMYFTLMAVELVYEGLTKRRTYRLNDAVTNINTGVLQQLTGTFVAIIKIGVYILVYEKLALFYIEPSWWSFALLMVLWELCYYWEHRMAHQISLFWGGHVVHHQSEDFNLSVALRQTSTGFIWGFPFFLPLALMGFDPEQFVVAGGFNLLYQFWIHTEHIDRMPRWFEAIFNTPSHHRVHHGRDPEYIDKNFGGVLIVWDRLFDTFTREEQRPHYGITKPLRSWNPVYANFAHYIDLWRVSRRARSYRDVFRILFRKPGWLPDYLGGYQTPTPIAEGAYRKYEISAPLRRNLYILVQFVGALLFNALYLFKHSAFDSSVKVAAALWIIWTTIMFGLLFERLNRGLFFLEIFRLATIPAGIYLLMNSGFALPTWILVVAAVFAVGSLFFLLRLSRTEAKLGLA